MNIKKHLNEIDDIFKFEKEPTINFKNTKGEDKTIFISAVYSPNKQWKDVITSYHISMKNSSKYLFKSRRKKEILDYAKHILKKEWFKSKKDIIKSINTKCNDLWIDPNQLKINNWLEQASKIYDLKKDINSKIEKKYNLKSVYDNIWDFLDTLQFTIIHKNDKSLKGEEEYLIENMYWQQSFCWSTDYKDHRTDTKEELMKLMNESRNYSKWLQILHYINYNTWDFYNTIELVWEYWGWTAKFVK